VNDYCEGAREFLAHAYDPKRALFSYSTRMAGDGGLVNDFAHPQTIRYTINTYLGLAVAERHAGPTPWLGEVRDRVRDFVRWHGLDLEERADDGLLLVLLAAVDPGHPAVRRSLGRIAAAVERSDAARRFNLQDLAWMLWGATATEGDAQAEAVAHRIFDVIRRRFVEPGTGLPRHSTAPYRRNIVSFGSLVYFLRAMHEYAGRFDDETARALFAQGVVRALRLQGPNGEWPWMIDIRSGVPFDRYPVFTVHQDSMAMLFLHPAERLGMAGASEAIERSFVWNLGANELGETLVRTDPCFFVYRSIERDDANPRLRRYLRGLGPATRRYPPRASRVRFNRECRSYHLGWVLFEWADRAAVPRQPASSAPASNPLPSGRA
jgi:plasmid stabilization system protein ParE